MSASRSIVLLSICLYALVTPLAAQYRRPTMPDPSRGYDWRKTAGKAGLSADQIKALARDKVLISDKTYRQVFDPYIGGSLPVFITSDSLLNGFHVLYEESILRLESANVPRLRATLRHMWDGLTELEPGIDKSKPMRWSRNKAFYKRASEKAKPVIAKSLRAAEVIVGTALRLMGESAAGCSAETAKLIEIERTRVLEARARVKPAWLGPPERSFVELDYSRYQPRGFYARSERLKGYFRAVSWLQSIPLRIKNDVELMTALLIGRTLREDRFTSIFRGYRRFIGRPDDWDAMRAAEAANAHLDRLIEKADFVNVWLDLANEARWRGAGAYINDLVRFPLRVPEIGFRVLSAYRTPDAMLFHKTTDIRQFKRPFPSGLEVAILLGSDAARRHFKDPEREQVLKIIDRSKRLLGTGSLYGQYLHCITALIDDPEHDAPAFMKSDAWQRKSLQTVLGGWAQLRHTWVLQAKLNVEWLCRSPLSPGFVEPEPTFFKRMAKLAESTEKQLQAAGAFEGVAFAEEIHQLIALRKRVQTMTRPAGDELLSTEDMVLQARLQHAATFLRLDRLKELAADLETGRPVRDAKQLKAVKQCCFDVAGRWRNLARLCKSLESLAHRQLRGVPLDKHDVRFIKGYGSNLAHIMFYEGNSYHSPTDDAMRIVDVVHNPQIGRYLHVGVARPRAIYVLYPTKGGEVLCRGAVMPYYEFAHPTRLTDGKWKQMLSGPKRPKPPAWLTPILPAGGLKAPRPPAKNGEGI